MIADDLSRAGAGEIVRIMAIMPGGVSQISGDHVDPRDTP
jgi:hypothetical protein